MTSGEDNKLWGESPARSASFNYFSTSFAAPHLFGERRAQFEADLRAELAARSPSGLFWDWPGDTAILLASKPEE